jgi:hypothetical protein
VRILFSANERLAEHNDRAPIQLGSSHQGLLSLSIALLVLFLLNRRSARRRPASSATATGSRAIRVSWRDGTVEVRARVVPRYGWLTTSIDVYLDDVAIIKTGGVFRFSGSNEAAFDEQGEKHAVKHTWRSPMRGMDFPFRLLVDDQVIVDSKIRPPNWPLSVVMVILSVSIAFSAIIVLVHLALSYLRAHPRRMDSR